MKHWLLGVLTAAFVLAAAVSGPMSAAGEPPGASTPWSIGDVFVAVGHADLSNYSKGGGVYRVLTSQGVLKNEPDLVDFTVDEATGCAVDVATGDLFTTSFWGMAMSRFDGAGATHPLEGSVIDVANLPMNLPVGKSAPSLPITITTAQPKTVYNMAVESVVFDRAGDMFVGAQVLPEEENVWTGHAWILKISKAGVLLDWWQVDAGDEQNPNRNPAISSDVHGADWIDLSQDETTIYYTSEDTFIRSFRIAGAGVGLQGLQGPAVPIHNVNGVQIGGKAFALRILPPGDPANGFLVATSSAVYRVAQNGEIVAGYYDLGHDGYFALNITPDGKSFWTSTYGGAIYKFHISSYRGFDGQGNLAVPGTMAGPFSTGTAAAGGICVKREYTASQNVCFETDLYGQPVTDASDPSGTGFKTIECTLPPTAADCQANPTHPDCVPPGTPTLQLADQLNTDGQSVDVQMVGVDPWGEGLTWSVVGLPAGMDANGADQPLTVSATGRITGSIKWHDSAQSPYTVTVTVTNMRGQATTGRFTWVITNQNSPPTLSYTGGNRSVLVGNPFTPQIVMSGNDLDQDSLVITATHVRYLDAGFTTPAPEGPQQGLPLGMTFELPGYPNGEATASIADNWTIPLGGQPEVTGTTFPRFYRITVQACDCNAAWDHDDPALQLLHRPIASVNITVTNTTPTFSVANQLTVAGTNVTYTQPLTSADDPDGPNHRPVTFAVEAGQLPPGLLLTTGTLVPPVPGGAISGVPTTAGTYTPTLRGSDRFGAFVDHAFTWDIIARPLNQVTEINQAASYQLPGLPAVPGFPNGHAVSYVVSGLPLGLAADASGLISGTPPTAVLVPAVVSVTFTDTVTGLSAATTFTWTVNASPTLSVVDQTTLITTSASYQPVAGSPNGNPLSFSILGLPTGLNYSTTTGLITGTPTAVVNAAPVSVTVTDTVNGLSTTRSFTWTVYGKPTLVIPNKITPVGSVVSEPLPGASVPTGLSLSYALLSGVLPVGLTMNANGLISGTANTPVTNTPLTVRVTQAVAPGITTSTDASFLWTVNAPPVLNSANQTALVNVVSTYTLTATDTAGDTLTYGTPTITYAGIAGWITFVPPLAPANPAPFTFTATPTLLHSGSVATISLTVTDAFGVPTTTTLTWRAITNRPPLCEVGSPSKALWPPNHKFVDVTVNGVTDPDDGDVVTITIDSIWQDEPVTTNGSGHTDPDGRGLGTSVASVRAERTGVKATPGDGRIYQINFSASDGKGGTCTGSIYVGVPHDQGGRSAPKDSGIRYNSVTGFPIY